MPVEGTDDPAAFLAAAGPLLAADPAGHTFHLSLALDRVRRPVPGRYWWVTRDGDVVGAALQTPRTAMLTLGPMDDDAVVELAASISAEEPHIPEVYGPAAAAARFAGCRSERRHEPAHPVEGQRLCRCTTVVSPDPPADGRARRAEIEDVDLAAGWFERFCTETGLPSQDAHPLVDQAVADRTMWIWDDDGPASMLRVTPPANGVARLGIVYTPPNRRRRGIAATFTAAVTGHVLDAGCDAVVLLTQLSNPTSNGVYRRVGFVPLHEMLRYRFDPAH